MSKKQLPPEIKDALNEVAKKYSESKSTTNAGRVLRFVARFVSVETIIKLFAHKVK